MDSVKAKVALGVLHAVLHMFLSVQHVVFSFTVKNVSLRFLTDEFIIYHQQIRQNILLFWPFGKEKSLLRERDHTSHKTSSILYIVISKVSFIVNLLFYFRFTMRLMYHEAYVP